jgi:predicted nucleotidyltransferase
MISISRDISSKLTQTQAEVLVDIAGLAKNLSIPFFVVGATARDIMFDALFGVQTVRATLDLDLAIRVARWEEYQELKARMIAENGYTADTTQIQRLNHKNGMIVDLVPFGPLETPVGTVVWPPEHDIEMSTVGFEEALESSTNVIVAHDPNVEVKVCTPAALTVMKLVSWNDKYPDRTRDAEDMMFFMKEYIELGNENRLWDTDSDILAEGNFKYELASARLLGRDIRKVINESTRQAVIAILTKETDTETQMRLVTDIAKARLGEARDILALLAALRRGISEA